MHFLAVLFAIPQTPQHAQFRAPAGVRPARLVPGGTTILPNGRLLTPRGKRLWVGEDLWQVLLSPNQRTIVGIHDGGLSVFDDAAQEKPARRFISRGAIAPAGVFSHNGSQLVISNGESGGIELLSGSDVSTKTSISANVNGFKDSYVNDIVLSADDKVAYAVDIANQRLVVVDLIKGQVATSVRAGRQPYALALSDDGRRLFVANIGLFDYSVIPPPSNGAGSPRGISHPAFGFPSEESESGVSFEGRRIPGLGSPYVPDAQSIYCYELSDPLSPRLRTAAKAGLLIYAPADSGKAVGGSSPNSLLVRGGLLYVSCANNDVVQVFDVKDLKLLRTFKLSPSPLVAKLRGAIPSGMALDSSGRRLYVCESGLNAIAVMDTKTGSTLGHIPTAWFPMQVRISRDDRTLYIATQKGLGRGPRGPLDLRPASDERAGLSDMPGMINVVTVPIDSELVACTQEVLRNNGIIRPSTAMPTPAVSAIGPIGRIGPMNPIKYVVFITKENHTFDGVFGGLKGANGQPDYAEWGANGWIHENGKSERLPIMPNHTRIAKQFAISDNFYMEPQASGDGHRWLVGVYPSSWTTRVFYAGWNFRKSDTVKGRLVPFGSNGSQIPEDYLENGSLWEHLHRGGITFRNYGEGFEFPGTDEGEGTLKTGTFNVVNHPMPKVLWDNTCWDFPIFNMNIPDIARVEWFKEDLEKNYRKAGRPIPRFINITLCNDHGTKPNPSTGYPYVCSYMADNDLATGRLLEYLSGMAEWKQMAVFITEDDSGGDDDHVDRHRSFVLAAGPFARRGYISHEHTSIMSILKTIYEIFGLGPNNMFDALATDLRDMFTDKPDFRGYTHIPVDPRVFKPEATVDPADPKFERRKLAPTVRLDDPEFIRWLRRRSGSGE